MKVLRPEERTELVENIASHLCGAQEFIQQRAVRNFSHVDPEYGRRIQELLSKIKQQKIQVCYLHCVSKIRPTLSFLKLVNIY